MGLFDIFKKKEVTSVNAPIEENKVLVNDKIEIVDVVKPIEKAKEIIVSNEVITETVYKFNGINYDFIDKLYFVNEEQKSKVLKFINALIVKFKFDEIKTQKDYFKFEDNLSKYYDFVDNYKDVYNDENGLNFPYFDFTDYVSWTITDIYSLKDSNGIINENSRKDSSFEKSFNSAICLFNVKNKTINNYKDIALEETFINDDNNKYNRIDGVFIVDALIPFYFKFGDFDKVDNLFQTAIGGLENNNKEVLEMYNFKLADLYLGTNQISKAIEILQKGTEQLKINFPKPKTKTMGSFVYKKLVQLLNDQKEYQKALLTINEAVAYNESLSFKQIQAKIEKELAK